MAGKDEQEFPPQHQEMPGEQEVMAPEPLVRGDWYRGSGKLTGRVALITGADSGIGQSTAVFFAKEGADVSAVYYNEHEDAGRTREMVEDAGGRCLLIAGDVKDPGFCSEAVERTVRELGGLNILVNNAGYQHYQTELETLPDEELMTTFATNIFGYIFMARAALPLMGEGDCVINTASITAYMGSTHLLDYSSTKGAIVSFTRSLSEALADRGIRVNGVAPGPIWTPLIPSSFPADYVANFGRNTPMGRAGQPEEVAPCFVFLASRDSSYMSGQMLHPNGGVVVNG